MFSSSERKNNAEQNRIDELIVKTEIISLKEMIFSLELNKFLSIIGCCLIFGLILPNNYSSYGVIKIWMIIEYILWVKHLPC